jgi:hypothetical protein
VQTSTPSDHRPGEPIKLALRGLPRLVDDIITSLLYDVPDVEVTTRVVPTDDLRDDFERSGADLMLCALGEGEMEAAWHASLRQRPQLAVFNLASDHRFGTLYVLETRAESFTDLSAASLVEAILRHLPNREARDP